MKKLSRIIALVLTAAVLLSVCAFAAPAGEGLTVFDDVAAMTSYTFSDLSSQYWAFSGIKACYDKGILLGYEDETYHPEWHVSWAQAIVIAARIHAAYFNNALDIKERQGDEWYSPYYRYCEGHKMLPSTCPKGVYLDGESMAIPRYDLAYIFSRTVSKDDMPAISTRQISDLKDIPSMYVDSVKTLYSAGILTGWENYNFSGERLTTRAQIAVVVSRLLLPSERVGYDSRANLQMEDFQANLENDSVAVQLGEKYYCLYKYYKDPSTELYALYRTDGADDTKELYTCPEGQRLENLSLYQSKVYFTQYKPGTAEGKLLCFDPASGKVSTVYEGRQISSFCHYNGKLYALTMTGYSKTVADCTYEFDRIADGKLIKLFGSLDYYKAKDFQPYGWNGSIYFKYSAKDGPTNLYRYILSDDKVEKVSDVNINSSFFDGHVMYFLAFDANGDYDTGLYAMSIQAPAVIKKIGDFPNPTAKRFRSVYKHDDTFYCLASNNKNLYSMGIDGSTRIALICGGVYNALCFTEDKAILIPNKLTVDNPNELKIYNSASMSSRAAFGDWIGLSCYYEGARFAPEKGKSVYTSEESVSSVTNLNITVPEAFTRGDDFIVRAKYVNNTGEVINLRSYIVKVYLDGVLVAHDINRMVSMQMDVDGIKTYTFVIADSDVLRDFEVSDGRVSVEIIPTHDVVVVDTAEQTIT